MTIALALLGLAATAVLTSGAWILGHRRGFTAGYRAGMRAARTVAETRARRRTTWTINTAQTTTTRQDAR
jgi:hypothetical protein